MKNNNNSSPRRLAVDFRVVKADYMIVSECVASTQSQRTGGSFTPRDPDPMLTRVTWDRDWLNGSCYVRTVVF